MVIPQPFLVFDDQFWGVLVKSHPITVISVWCFSRVRLGLCFIGRTTTELKHHFHNILSKVYTIMWFMPVVDLDHLAEVAFRISPLVSYASAPSVCTCWKKVTMWSPHRRSEELDSPPWGQSMCMKCLEFFCSGICLLPAPHINLLNYLCQYKLMDIYFIVWLLMQYYFVLF